jgi:hypothetical protein
MIIKDYLKSRSMLVAMKTKENAFLDVFSEPPDYYFWNIPAKIK